MSSSFPCNDEFDVYIATQKKGEGAIAWEELATNKIYRVTPAPIELSRGNRYKLMEIVDAENEKISVWTPVDTYSHLIKYGLDSYFRTLAPKSRGRKRKSIDYEAVFLTNHGKMRCLHHSKSDEFVKEIRKVLRHGVAKDSKSEVEKKKEQEGILNYLIGNPTEKAEEKKID